MGSRDLLEIKVFEVPELNIEQRIDADGTVDLPLLRKVKLEGLTSTEAADRLRRTSRPRKSSEPCDRADTRVPLEADHRPRGGAAGPLAYTGNWTLLDVLAAVAPGTTVGDKIYILRRAQNGLTTDLYINARLILRADPYANILIYPNDLINVPSRTNITIYCLGEFRSRGAVVPAPTASQ